LIHFPGRAVLQGFGPLIPYEFPNGKGISSRCRFRFRPDFRRREGSSDYIQVYAGDKETLVRSLERIQATAGEIIDALLPEIGTGNVTVSDEIMQPVPA
jgi:hypothetical protein